MSQEMKLPEGFTCADCFAFYYCEAIGTAKPENKSCDWAPSRFAFNIEKARALKNKIRTLEAEVAELKAGAART